MPRLRHPYRHRDTGKALTRFQAAKVREYYALGLRRRDNAEGTDPEYITLARHLSRRGWHIVIVAPEAVVYSKITDSHDWPKVIQTWTDDDGNVHATVHKNGV